MSKLYVIVRNDIPSLNPGKAMAQVNHAGTHFLKHFLIDDMKCRYESNTAKSIKNWLDEAGGFGTVIVLEGTKRQIEIMDKWTNKIRAKGLIVDPTYPYRKSEDLGIIWEEQYDADWNLVEEPVLVREELTCFYIYIEEEDEEWFKGLCKCYDINLAK